LEKEFVEQEASEESSAAVSMDNVQDAGSDEVVADEPIAEEVDEPVADHKMEPDKADEEVVSQIDEAEDCSEMEEDFSDELDELEDNIVSMEDHPVQSEQVSAGEMSFSGHGQMDFNMNFALGGKEAKLVVEGGKLKVMVSGVELYLSEDGCEVEMSGGVHFSIPFEGATGHAGKKAS